MNVNKALGRVATTLVAGAMLTALAMPAYAAGVTTGTETEPVTSVTITKTVETDGNTYAPNTTFNFTVTEGGEKSFNDGTSTVTAKAGVPGGLVAGNGAAFAPVTKEDEKVVAPSVEYTATATLNVVDSVFEVPGIYHYVVTEANTSYEGVTKDNSTYDVYLYVYNNDDYDDLYVGHVVSVKNGATSDADAKADLIFTNRYTTGSVTVTKYVKGSFANMGDTFAFTVGVSGTEGEAYKVVYTQKDVPVTTFVESGKTIDVSGIGDEDTITIYGLSANDIYTVTENDGVTRGYTVTDTVGDNDGKVSGTTSTAPTASITNTKDATAPTGIVMNVAPYVLLVVVAAAGCFVFLRKRRED